MDDYNFISVSKWNLKKTFGSFSFFFNTIKKKKKGQEIFDGKLNKKKL